MAELELGVFIVLNVVALSGFFAAKQGFGVVLILSFIIFAGLCLILLAEYDIVQTKSLPLVNATATSILYDSNSTLVSSEERSSVIPAYDEKQYFINSDQNTIGLVYGMAAVFSLAWFLKVVMSTVQSNKKRRYAGF